MVSIHSVQPQSVLQLVLILALVAIAVRRIRSNHNRPSLKQLEAEVDDKNAELAAEEKAERKKERKAKRKEAERQDKLRKRRDEDNVDPPLVNISSDGDDVSHRTP